MMADARKPDAPTPTREAVWIHYRPGHVRGEFGWLWSDIDGQGKRWNLVCTHEGDDEDTLRFFDPTGAVYDGDFTDDAEAYRNTPYLPCSAPTVTPGHCDAGEIICRVANGATITTSYADAEAADAATRAVLTVRRPRGPEAGE